MRMGTALHAVDLSGAAPAWVHLLPRGTFRGRDGRGPWRVDDPVKIAAATQAHARGVKLPVDYDHQTDFAAIAGVGGRAPAAGWIVDFQARADGLWGRVEWTAAARTAIQAREYRYLSPVFDFDRRTGRVIRLQRAGLTNIPNLAQLTALCSRRNQEQSMPDFLSELADWLGLTDGADDAAVRAAFSRRLGLPETASATDLIQALDKAMPKSGTGTEAMAQGAGAAALQALSHMVAENLVETAIAGGVLPPAGRDAAIALCRADPAAFRGFCESTGPVFSYLTRPLVPGAPPAGRTGHRLSGDELEVCRAMNLPETDYQQSRGS